MPKPPIASARQVSRPSSSRGRGQRQQGVRRTEQDCPDRDGVAGPDQACDPPSQDRADQAAEGTDAEGEPDGAGGQPESPTGIEDYQGGRYETEEVEHRATTQRRSHVGVAPEVAEALDRAAYQRLGTLGRGSLVHMDSADHVG